MPVSKRVVASYVFDWVVVIAIAILAWGFSEIDPHYHAFSPLDLSISYPLKEDTVSYYVAGIVVGVVPAAIIFLVAMLCVPGPAAARNKPWSHLIRLKLWEWHTGWLGLAMSLAVAVCVTEGLKNVAGKPRPNALARCMPDLANVEKYRVGGYGQDFNPAWIVVSKDICTQTDRAVLNDGFQSWPSGHSSTSFAGLLYLTLYLCSKFAVVLPYLSTAPSDSKKSDSPRTWIPRRDEAAAPPVYTIFFILVPLGGASYIAVSRWMDYAHHGFDIISGSLLGALVAYVSFRWYHLPIAQGSGWAWGPRSPGRAFGVGVGSHGYVSPRRFEEEDVEMGRVHKEEADEVHVGTPLVGPREGERRF